MSGIYPEFHDCPCYNILKPWLQRGSYITFFTLVGDISHRQANTREISNIFHFTAIHFLPERHSAMVLMYIYMSVCLSCPKMRRRNYVRACSKSVGAVKTDL